MKENCNKCGRLLGDGTGGYQSDKTCTGKCLTKEQILPPSKPKPIKYKKNENL